MGDARIFRAGLANVFRAARRGAVLIVMLGGGDKSTQAADIAKAIALAGTLED